MYGEREELQGEKTIKEQCPDCLFPIVVGIGGASRSGKTTLVEKLHREYLSPVQIISLDQFYKEEEVPFDEECNFPNYECPDCIDFERLRKELHKEYVRCTIKCFACCSSLNDNRPYLFIEGFLLYSDQQLCDLIDKKLFLSVSKNNCYKRRMETSPVPEIYFHKVLWPSYIKYNSPVLNMNDAYILNGDESIESVTLQATRILNGEAVKSCKEHFSDVLKSFELESQSESKTRRTPTIWIARHGHRQDYINSNFKEENPERPHDSPLSERGLLQAQELAQRLKSTNISKIFSSPFLRTVQTANEVSKVLGVKIYIEEGLREWISETHFQSKPKTLSKVEISEKFPSVDMQYEDICIPEYPESPTQFMKRTKYVIDKIVEKYANSEEVLLVTHASTLIGLTRGLIGKEKELRCGLCCLVKLTRDESGQWNLELNGDTSFLSSGEEDNATDLPPEYWK